MGSPTKRKYRQGVQQEILTNYYLSKYNKFMSKYNTNPTNNELPHRSSQAAKANNNPKRKNFKEVMLERKGSRMNYTAQYQSKKGEKEPRSPSFRKNFKEEIEEKNSRQKVQKQNRKNFYRLEDTIINQLYKPTPSKIEQGKFKEIQVMHKITYNEKVQPFRLAPHEQQQNIEIAPLNSYSYTKRFNPNNYQVQTEKIQINKLSNAIRSSFEKRSASKNKKQSKSPQQPRKSSSFHSPQPQSHDSYLFQNVRSNFASVEEKRLTLYKKQEEQSQSSVFDAPQNKIMIDFVVEKDQKHSNNSKQHSNSLSKSQYLRISRKSSTVKSIAGEKKRKNSSAHEDSFHRHVPQIQREPRLSVHKEKREVSEQNKSFASRSSRAKDSEQNNKSAMHELSMLSRFSMTSTEGGMIVDYLEKELNENEFGPYQNALTSLLDLIGQYPNAWPIFVVGQRILEDRHQYDNKRTMQQNQISKLQSNIQHIKRSKQKQTVTQKNAYRIMRMIRQLAGLLQPLAN